MYRWSQPKSGSTIEFTLYNFEPNQAYNYKVQVVGTSTNKLGTLSPNPSLPTGLGDLKFTSSRLATSQTNYVLFDTMDCTRTNAYLVAYDARHGWISWYQDIAAETGGTSLSGWSYAENGNIMAVVDHDQVIEWGWDGAAVNSESFSGCGGGAGDLGPCPSHDAFRSSATGNTYVVTAFGDTSVDPSTTTDFSSCSTADGFVQDGFQVLDGSFAETDTQAFDPDLGFDPSVDGGPEADCDASYWLNAHSWDTSYNFLDWLHVNSISAVTVGTDELLTLSSKKWSEIVRYDPTSGNVAWTMQGTDTSRGDMTISLGSGVTGETDFGGQHNVTENGNHLMMFDNRQVHGTLYPEARVIRMEISPPVVSPPTNGSAVIVQNFMLREPGTASPRTGLTCSYLGSAVSVPGTLDANVLADCGPQTVIEELDQADGSQTTDPLFYLALDHGGSTRDYCIAGADPASTMYWYRAWPVTTIGEF